MSVPQTRVNAPAAAALQTYPFTLSELPYVYDALEPHLDQKTLQIHHRGHHATYVQKLNDALAKHPALHKRTLAQLLAELAKLPADIRTAVKNNGGGHLNHDLFWGSLAAPQAQAPKGALLEALEKQFGSFAQFHREFSDAAEKHFASGWVALAFDHDSKELGIADLKDHEIVAPETRTTLLILDVWEHAYYVKFQNRRAEFIEAFWKVVNWQQVGVRYEHAR